MNKLSLEQYSDKHIRRIKLFEREFLRTIQSDLQKEITEIIRILKTSGLPDAIRYLDKTNINHNLGSSIMMIYKIVGLYFANKTLLEISRIKEHKAGFGFNKEFIQRIIEFFQSFLLNKAILPISKTLQSEVLTILVKAQNEGWGIDKTVYELNSSELTIARARTIVRTEINKAMNFGQRLAEEKSLVETTKTWVGANDNRERHSHVYMNGTEIDFDKKFKVPIMRGSTILGYEEMTGPGDVEASAGNVINCRCTLAFAGKRDKNGRLIRKSKNNISLLQQTN